MVHIQSSYLVLKVRLISLFDTDFRITYPLTQTRVREVSNEKEIMEDNRRYDN